jgi:hypothetical protein
VGKNNDHVTKISGKMGTAHTNRQSVFKKLLHSYRVNIENPEINLGEFSEEPPLFILKYFAS